MFNFVHYAIRRSAIVVIAVWIGGCSTEPEPYIYISDEFNRGRQGFGQPVANPNVVEICYRARSTPWEDIQAMATQECGRVGKTATPVSRNFLSCSLSAPTMARFVCR